MKFLFYSIIVLFSVFATTVQAQRAVVTANSYDISDNLDLQAVASIFGDAKDLADFEYRLNDPSLRINNLDLNKDGYVDYLRVVEVVEGNAHLIVIQAVLGRDMYQDIATIEIEKNTRRNQVSIQIVGNSYLYGPNYIYEPVYVATPPVFSLFWGVSYRPYYSSWYWGYYPSYYSYYAPYPTPTYMVHVHNHINYNNRYVYTTNHYSNNTRTLYSDVRRDSYERSNPNNSFYDRNNGYSNRYDLATTRSSYRSSTTGNESNSRGDYATASGTRDINRVEGSNARSSYSSSSDSSYRRGEAVSDSNSSNSRSSYSSSSDNSSSRSNSSSSTSGRTSNSGYSNSSYSNSGSSSPSYSRSSSSSSTRSSSNYTNSGSSSPSYSRSSSSSSSSPSYSRSSSSYSSGSSSPSYSRSSSSGSSSGSSRSSGSSSRSR